MIGNKGIILQSWLNAWDVAKSTLGVEFAANRDVSDGYPSLSGFALKLKNAAGTFTSTLTNTATAARVYTLQDKSYTLADDADLVDASTSSRGFVNTVAQAFSGLKTFANGIVLGGDIRANLFTILPTSNDLNNIAWIKTPDFNLLSAGALLRIGASLVSGKYAFRLEALGGGGTEGAARLSLEAKAKGSFFLSVEQGGNIVLGENVGPSGVSSDRYLINVSRNMTQDFFSSHGLEDSTVLNGGGGNGSYATFDAKTQILAISAHNYNHVAGYQTRIEMNGSGTVSYLYGFMSEQHVNAGGVSNIIAFQAREWLGAGSVTNHYGFKSESLTAAANNWAFYSVSAKSYFGGKIGIGSGKQSPTAWLDIAASTGSAGSAPIKLAPGTLLTSVENGSIEFDGINFYLSSGGVRKTIVVV